MYIRMYVSPRMKIRTSLGSVKMKTVGVHSSPVQNYSGNRALRYKCATCILVVRTYVCMCMCIAFGCVCVYVRVCMLCSVPAQR